MSQENIKNSSDEPAVKIDYDNIDVARIMDGIKKKIASQAGGESVGPDEPAVPDSVTQPASWTGIKKLLLKIMSPFAPLIKLLVLPVYEEHRQTVMILDHTNRRLDQLTRIPERVQDYINLTHNLCHNLVVELTKLKIEVDLLKTKVQIMEKDFEFLGKRERVLEKEVFK